MCDLIQINGVISLHVGWLKNEKRRFIRSHSNMQNDKELPYLALTFHKEGECAHKTSLTLPRPIMMPVQGQQSERSCTCALGFFFRLTVGLWKRLDNTGCFFFSFYYVAKYPRSMHWSLSPFRWKRIILWCIFQMIYNPLSSIMCYFSISFCSHDQYTKEKTS